MPEGRLWYEWRYLDQIRPFIAGPMLVKGILTAEDALLCLEHGAQGLVVSNYGRPPAAAQLAPVSYTHLTLPTN